EIKLEAATPHGIQQSGLAVRRAKSYVGRVYLAGAPGARAKLRLVWGADPQDRQEITIPALHSEFVKVPLKFTAGADSDDARLEIVGTGTGSFHVGTISLMPADNLHEFRPDTIALLRQLNSGFWRSSAMVSRSEEHTSELQSLRHLVCRLLLEKKNTNMTYGFYISKY